MKFNTGMHEGNPCLTNTSHVGVDGYATYILSTN